MKLRSTAIALGVGAATAAGLNPAIALDLGPRVAACDYKLSSKANK